MSNRGFTLHSVFKNKSISKKKRGLRKNCENSFRISKERTGKEFARCELLIVRKK